MVSTGKQSEKKQLSKSEVIIGGCILIVAQLSASSTASCVEALPHETPSILRGLWRQVLTSIFFSIITLSLMVHGRYTEAKAAAVGSEANNLLSKEPSKTVRIAEDVEHESHVSKQRIVLVAIAVLGSTLLNDAIIFALQYASSAAVMCLCNTTPIWLILYAIVNCGMETPGKITILGAFISLIGAIICSTGESDDGSEHENESLGAAIALLGAIGGASYMTATRELNCVGINPIILSLTINIGMATTTLILCLLTLPNGINFFSTNIVNGFFGFLDPIANPAAILHSIFPDMFGNFGAMIALSYFEPLIVSMVFLTEPLNASIIAMNFVGEAPPSKRTIVGVAIVLTGCLIVLLRANTSVNEEEAKAQGDVKRRMSERRKRASVLLYSQVNSVAPNVTATAAYAGGKVEHRARGSLPDHVIRSLQLEDDDLLELEDISTMGRNAPLQRALTAPINGNGFRRLSQIVMKGYGTMDSYSLDVDDEDEDEERIQLK